MACGIESANALGFDVKPAQTEQPCLGIIHHRFEAFAGIFRAPFQHSGLRFEKLYQRLLIGTQQFAGLLGHAARCFRIAGPGCNQSG